MPDPKIPLQSLLAEFDMARAQRAAVAFLTVMKDSPTQPLDTLKLLEAFVRDDDFALNELAHGLGVIALSSLGLAAEAMGSTPESILQAIGRDAS